MKRQLTCIILPLLFLANTTIVSANDERALWLEFVERLKRGDWTKEEIRPYDVSLTDAIIGFLKTIKETAQWEDFSQFQEVYHRGNQIRYVSTVRLAGDRQTLCFTLLIEEDRWYFQHLESITIRLDQVDSLPTSVFPDLDVDVKAWIREEIRVSNQVRLFKYLSESIGYEAALGWFRDGAGYFLAAQSWVPLLEPERAFILYLCWDLANLQGNTVTLEELNDHLAVVRARMMYFQMYTRTAHLRTQITLAEYTALFETIWQDRALSAGWNLRIALNGDECIFTFTRP